MDDFDLDALRDQLKQLQEKPAETRYALTDRNGVDLVMRLIERGLVKLIFSADGKEYYTQARLEQDALRELQRQGGRLSTYDLAPLLNVSLGVAESTAAALTSSRGRSVRLLDGELITSQYMDHVAAEVAEMLDLSDRGMLSTGDLAARFSLPLDFFSQQILEPRVGSVLKGSVRIDGTVIYNQTYVDWHRAHVRGLLTAATRPTSLMPLIASYGLNEKLFFSVLQDLIRTGRLDGTLLNRTHYVPSVYENARIQWARSFFASNQYIDFSMVTRMHVMDARGYVEAALPDVVCLKSCAVARSVIDAIEAAVSAAIGESSATDLSVLVPPGIESRDVAALLAKCPSLSEDDDGRVGAFVLSDHYVVSQKLVDILMERFGKWYHELAESGELKPLREAKEKEASGRGNKKGGKASNAKKGGKRGKKHEASDDEDDDACERPKAPVSVPQKAREEVAEKVLEWLQALPTTPSMESVEDVEDLASFVSSHVAPRAYELRCAVEEEAAASAAAGDAESQRESQQHLQEAVTAAFVDAWLASRVLPDLPEGDAAAIDKHIQRTVCWDLVSALARSQALYHRVALEDVAEDAEPAEIVKRLPAEAAAPIKSLLDLLAKGGVLEFVDEVPMVASDLGFRLRKPDSATQARRLAQHAEKLEESLEAEKRPPAALHTAVMLVHTRALQCYLPAPPKCLHVLLARLQECLTPTSYKVFRDYQQLVVSFLRAGTKHGEQEEKLNELLPGLKSAAKLAAPAGTSKSSKSK
eukprot:m51a1_g3179 putative E3 UFM1-protein ligase (757) ;mRNA; r:409852-412658